MNFVKLVSIIVCLYCGIVFAQTPKAIKSLKPTGFYNNFSKQFPNFITKNESEVLEDKLRNFSNTGFGEIAVVIVDDYQGMEENAFATELFNHFQIGKKGKNNGVLLLIKPTQSPPGRRVYISTGYGAEALLTDSESKLIIENLITPQFKASQYFQGLALGANSISKILSENKYELGFIFTDQENYQNGSLESTNTSKSINQSANAKADFKLEVFILLVILLMILSEVFAPRRKKSDSHIYFASGFGGSGWGSSGSSFGSGFGGFGGGSSGGGGAGGGW